ncbi:MAG: glycosyltransferase family 2 protein [Candidatus Aenigmarchaeota archaeon]|nr:glycosyltransferase family 2 protein [Candidatus Aenigmarchaeota archaeon]
MRKIKVSIVIPTLNEEKNLPIVLREIKKFFKERKDYTYEIIVVDGYSTDRTVEIARRNGCKVLFDDKGKGSALRKGMEIAKGDIIVTMDADVSQRPIELGLMLEGIRAGYDIVMGSRFIQGGGTEDMPWYRRLGNKFFVMLVNLFWRMKYTDLCYGYRAFRNGVWKKLNLKSDGFGIETEISIKAAKKKMKVLEVPSFEKKRLYGEGKLRTFKHGWVILKTIIKELLN